MQIEIISKNKEMPIVKLEEYLAFSATIVDKDGLNIRSLSVSMKADGAEIQIGISNKYKTRKCITQLNVMDMHGRRNRCTQFTHYYHPWRDTKKNHIWTTEMTLLHLEASHEYFLEPRQTNKLFFHFLVFQQCPTTTAISMFIIDSVG